MTQKPIDFETRLIEKECENPYEPGCEFSFGISSELREILVFASHYLHPDTNIEEEMSIIHPFKAISEAASKFSLEKIITKETFEDAQEYFSQTPRDISCRLRFNNPILFNDCINKFQIPGDETCSIVTYWFVDSFVKFYNNRPSPIEFPSKEETRKIAMGHGNQKVIDMAKENTIIPNFPLYKY